MSNKPAVAVVIPCWNHGRYLDEAVSSVLKQTLDDVEIVVVDDGSTDAFTRELLDNYVRPKTRVIRQRNQGLAASRNNGIRETSARYVCCLDADDRIRPRYLERTVEILDRRPEVGIAATYVQGFGGRELVWETGPCRVPEMLFGNRIVCSSLFRRDGWERAGGYREDLELAEDWDFWLSLLELGYAGEVVPEVLFEWRIREDSMWHADAHDPALMGRINRAIWEAHAPLYIAHLGDVAELVGADHAVARAAVARSERLERAQVTDRTDKPEVETPINRALILFRFHEEFELCRERVEFLAALNPGVPIYCVYGGPQENFATARSAVIDLVEHVHLAESHDFMWHWLHMDLDVKHWYRAVGHGLQFDVLFDYEWDILTVDGLASIYPQTGENTLALCALTKLTPAIERQWQWTGWAEYRPAYDRFIDYMRTTYGMGPLEYVSHGPGTVLPRRFLEQFAELDDVELVISEITYPAYAQALGFDLVNNDLRAGSVIDRSEDAFFNSDSKPIQYERIVAEVLKPHGRRAFHPVKFSFGERRLRELRAQRDDGALRDELARSKRELQALRGRVAGTDEVLQDVLSSASWRVTKPLRTLKRLSDRRARAERAEPVAPVNVAQPLRPTIARVKAVRDRVMDACTVTTSDGQVHEIFPASVTHERGRLLRDWVANEEAASTIETGLAYAISTLFICEGLLLAGHAEVHHVAFDPHQAVAYSNAGREVIEEAGLANVVEVHEQDSKVGVAKLVEQDRRFDLAFVDGEHLFEGVFIDLVFFDRLVRPGGVVIVDDLYLPAVARASRFATTNLGWTVEGGVGGEGGMKVFRTPRVPLPREWDHFVDF